MKQLIWIAAVVVMGCGGEDAGPEPPPVTQCEPAAGMWHLSIKPRAGSPTYCDSLSSEGDIRLPDLPCAYGWTCAYTPAGCGATLSYGSTFDSDGSHTELHCALTFAEGGATGGGNCSEEYLQGSNVLESCDLNATLTRTGP